MKKIIALLLVITCILLSLLTAGAKTVITYGDWVLEIIDNGTRLNLVSYTGSSQDIHVPRFIDDLLVVSFDDHCFATNTIVKTVYTDAPFNRIGDFVFIECTSLESIRLDPVLNYIGKGAFSGATSLKNVNLEDTTVSEIKEYSFYGCAIESIGIPETCTTIGNYAFAGCTQLAEITIPSSVTNISDNAFFGCEKLVIHAPYGSYAITYAIAHGIDYVYSDLEAYTFKRGDADLDNAITIMDATRIQRYLVHFENTNPDGRIDLRAAFGSDGKVSILDATRIQRYIARFNDPYNIGETVTVYLTPDGTVVDTVAESAETE